MSSYFADQSGSPPGEIRRLEVNDRLALADAEAAPVERIEFGLGSLDTQSERLVADVAGDQLDAIKAGSLDLPRGWEQSGKVVWGRRA